MIKDKAVALKARRELREAKIQFSQLLSRKIDDVNYDLWVKDVNRRISVWNRAISQTNDKKNIGRRK